MTRLLLAPFLLLLLASCSTAFHREWKSARALGAQPGITGAWQGTWRSESSGHHGKLRSVVGPEKSKAGDHEFHYHATWGGFLSGSYRTDHRIVPVKNGYLLSGQHQLPKWAGGLYTYKGSVQGDDFRARYECSLDKGVFEMKRVR